jgi:uncharacterized protein
MPVNIFSPVSQNNRLKIIDILRGWALLGVVLMNYNYADDTIPFSKADTVIDQIAEYIFAVKSWSLLSLLFGFGFGALYEKINNVNSSPKLFFIRRMGILLIFSIVNSAFYSGDILHDYALLGCVMLLFINLSPRVLFILSVIILFTTPFIGSLVVKHLTPPLDEAMEKLLHDQFTGGHFFITLKRNLSAMYLHEIKNMNYTITVHLQMLGMMLLGLTGFKSGFFENLYANKKRTRYICLNAFLFTVVLIEFKFIIEKNKWGVSQYYQLSWLRYDATVIFLVTGICLLYTQFNEKLKIFSAFLYSGTMTLTNYIVQNLLIFFLFSGVGLGLANKPGVKMYYGIALGVFIAQALFSILWLKKYRFGPAEWLWRCLSYGKWFTNKKAS